MPQRQKHHRRRGQPRGPHHVWRPPAATAAAAAWFHDPKPQDPHHLAGKGIQDARTAPMMERSLVVTHPLFSQIVSA